MTQRHSLAWKSFKDKLLIYFLFLFTTITVDERRLEDLFRSIGGIGRWTEIDDLHKSVQYTGRIIIMHCRQTLDDA